MRTCLLLLLLLSCTESGKVRLLELVEPILLDIEPSNLWDNWCCWSAMDNAWRCNSSSVTSFLCDLPPILLLLDPTSLESFFDIQIKWLPIERERNEWNWEGRKEGRKKIELSIEGRRWIGWRIDCVFVWLWRFRSRELLEINAK